MPRECDVMEIHQHAVAEEVGYADSRRYIESARAGMRLGPLCGIARIPVVVHVVHHTDAEDVPEAVVRDQITALNEDFRARNADIDTAPEHFRELATDARIEFELARCDPQGNATNGIVRTRTSVAKFPSAIPPGMSRSAAIDRELKLGAHGSPAWPADRYLNLWVCPMGRSPLGYAAFPGSAAWRDGVVIDTACFGRSAPAEPPFDRGRTATHEVGHWLDLLHIWGDDGGLCSRSDNVADTPNQAGPNYGTPAYPSVTCNNAPHGDMFMSFMDYVDDVAMVMFSRGQVARMHAALQGPRSSLLRSDGLAEPRPPDMAAGLAAIAEVAGPPGQPAEEVFDGVGWVRSHAP